jgi:hypothetical protein
MPNLFGIVLLRRLSTSWLAGGGYSCLMVEGLS